MNDSVKGFVNARMKKIVVDDSPRLCLFALKKINAGSELRYDYGDGGSKRYWWRKKVSLFIL